MSPPNRATELPLDDDRPRDALDAGADAFFAERPERGRYDRLIERLRGLVEGDDRTPRAAGNAATDSDE